MLHTENVMSTEKYEMVQIGHPPGSCQNHEASKDHTVVKSKYDP